MAVISPKAQELLDDLPDYYRDEPHTISLLNSIGGEVENMQETAEAMRLSAFPSQVDDRFGFLSMWERMLGLPVAPEGETEAQRRNAVLTQIRKRTSGSGADWVHAITQSLGTEAWSHAENDYVVTVTMPYAAPTYASRQTENLARQITPAHLQLEFVYGVGFVIGESLIGIDTL